MKNCRNMLIAFIIPLMMVLSFSASGRSLDVDYGGFHQAAFSAADMLVPPTATPERLSTSVLARSVLPAKPKAVDSVNDKVSVAGYKDRPGWFRLSAY